MHLIKQTRKWDTRILCSFLNLEWTILSEIWQVRWCAKSIGQIVLMQCFKPETYLANEMVKLQVRH